MRPETGRANLGLVFSTLSGSGLTATILDAKLALAETEGKTKIISAPKVIAMNWFWLLTRYLAGRLAVFGFLTPMAGVAFGVLLLGERLTPVFGLGALLVGAGIALVNAPRAKP